MSSDKAEFFHSLATLLDAGVPLARALDTAVARPGGRLASAVAALSAEIQQGGTLIEAFEGQGRVFSRFDRAVIRVGEAGGRLPQALGTLAEWHGFESGIQRKLLAALVLPVLVIHVAALVGPLPELFGQDSGVGTYLWNAFRIVALWYLAAALCWGLLRDERFRAASGRLLLGVPFLGNAFTHLELARYCRASHSLLQAGVGAVETARIATDACVNQGVADLVRGAIASAEGGEPLSAGFSPQLPEGFRAQWQSGETSGALDDATARLARQHGERAEELFAEITRWIPRLVYGVVMMQLAGMLLSRASVFGG